MPGQRVMGTAPSPLGRTATASLCALALCAAIAAPASASEAWRFEQSRDGAMAQSCGGTGPYTGCATLSCGSGGVIQFTLEDLQPGAPIRRDGRLASTGFSDKVKWNLVGASRRGGRDYIAAGLNVPALMQRLKQNTILGVVIDDNAPRRRGQITFALKGSDRAISRLESSCARIAAQPERRRDRDSGRGPDGRPGGRFDGPPRDRPDGPFAGPPGDRFSGRPGGPRNWTPVGPNSSPWRFASHPGGAVAQSCGEFLGRQGAHRQICATLFCGRGAPLSFGIDGLVETPEWSNRDGRIRIDGDSIAVSFNLTEGPRRGERIYVARHPRPERLAERLQAGAELAVSVQPNEEPFVFDLRNSGRAITNMLNRCERLSGRRDDAASDEEPVTVRYREDVVGHWATDRRSCRGAGWRFERRRVETPDGAVCDRVQVAEVGSGPLTGGVAIRGSQCRGGDPKRVGDPRVFETQRDGGSLALRAVIPGEEIRVGGRIVFRLEPRSRIVRLQSCGR